MRLAVFQIDAADAAAGEAGLRQVEACLRQAAEAGAALAHLPELALPGYGAGVDLLRAEADRAPAILARLQRRVEEIGTALAFGLPVAEGGAVRNAAALLRPGHAPLVYAKRFLYGDYERAAFAPGTAPSPVAEWAGWRIGFLVCFDVEFPETVRALALAGADLVLVPTALPAGIGARFIAQSLVPTRAFENGLFVSYADWCGADLLFRYQGLSVVASPHGIPLAQAGTEGAAMLLADLDLADRRRAQEANPYLDTLRAERQPGAPPS